MGCCSGVTIDKPMPTTINEIDEAVQQGKAVLGYWNIRGLGQGIRFLLANLNIPHLDKRYQVKQKDDGGYDVSDWFGIKPKMNIEFANLPYYIDNDIKIAETVAVYTYICRKHRPEYLGRNHVESARAIAIYSILKDFKSFYTQMIYRSPEDMDYITEICKKAKDEYGKIAESIKNRVYAASNHGPTFVDFFLFEDLNILEALSPGLIQQISPKLEEYKCNMEKLPGIQEAAQAAKDLPFNNMMARWKQSKQIKQNISRHRNQLKTISILYSNLYELNLELQNINILLYRLKGSQRSLTINLIKTKLGFDAMYEQVCQPTDTMYAQYLEILINNILRQNHYETSTYTIQHTCFPYLNIYVSDSVKMVYNYDNS